MPRHQRWYRHQQWAVPCNRVDDHRNNYHGSLPFAMGWHPEMCDDQQCSIQAHARLLSNKTKRNKQHHKKQITHTIQKERSVDAFAAATKASTDQANGFGFIFLHIYVNTLHCNIDE
mmetsp:Transcript_20796/g.57804  ORF Transcript_20796/g.57804 Transcript_20796/m.57804 type:complete len:117 (-) Transcript_20796:188-538(-)